MSPYTGENDPKGLSMMNMIIRGGQMCRTIFFHFSMDEPLGSFSTVQGGYE